jgi:hypothetical protein
MKVRILVMTRTTTNFLLAQFVQFIAFYTIWPILVSLESSQRYVETAFWKLANNVILEVNWLWDIRMKTILVAPRPVSYVPLQSARQNTPNAVPKVAITFHELQCVSRRVRTAANALLIARKLIFFIAYSCVFSGMSDKCPDPMPISDGTVCADEGRCKKGECVSYCEVMSPDWLPCTCENSMDNIKYTNLYF